METNQKKVRLPNFSSAEESLLLTLAEQHASIIENKKTDAVFSEEKKNVGKKLILPLRPRWALEEVQKT